MGLDRPESCGKKELAMRVRITYPGAIKPRVNDKLIEAMQRLGALLVAVSSENGDICFDYNAKTEEEGHAQHRDSQG
jgi:hypothetical protein